MDTKKMLRYEIKLFDINFIAYVQRKNRKYGESVCVILKDEYENELYKWISYLNAKDAALSAIASWYYNIPGSNF